MKITALGSSKLSYIYNNFDCTKINEYVFYPKYTKEFIQVINFCKFGDLSLEETLFTFRKSILFKTPILHTEELKNEFEDTDLFILEITSNYCYLYNNIYVHHIAIDDQYKISIKDKIKILVQTEDEIEKDIMYIKKILNRPIIIICETVNDGEKNELKSYLKKICEKNLICFIDPMKEFKKKNININNLFLGENTLNNYTDLGHEKIGIIYREYIDQFNNILYTNNLCTDGFGSQYSKIIFSYVLCNIKNKKFIYTPLKDVEHNYDNNILFINKLENIMNIKNNIVSTDDKQYNNENYNIIKLDHMNCVHNFLNNIDFNVENKHFDYIKYLFNCNKLKLFKNNVKNIAIHIRRENNHDNGMAGERITIKDSYFINVINKIKTLFVNDSLLFHIYSQGDINNFNLFKNDNTILHINEDIENTFIGLVQADVLVTSPSCFSFLAALLSDGMIIYTPSHWFKPRKKWIIFNDIL